MERPAIVSNEHLKFLDELRDSGAAVMYGARWSLMVNFQLTKGDAGDVLKYWMDSFGERH